jgi:DNA-binding SARP family transcriptional activator
VIDDGQRTVRPLRLQLVGGFSLSGGATPAVPGGQAARLLKLLAVHHDQQVQAATVVDVLWPDGAPPGAERNIAALVSRLRRVAGREAIRSVPDGYQLVTGPDLRVDLAEAEQLLATAEREQRANAYGLAQLAATGAEQLLGAGPVLADEPEQPWVIDARSRAARQLRVARACRWTAALASSDYAVAIQAAEAALAEDPLDEEACRALMQAYWRSALPGAALSAYERLRNALADALGIDPAEQTQALYFSVLHSEAAPSTTTAPARRPHGGRPAGRDTELADLARGWAEAMAGRGGRRLVVGPAGIGKRTLVNELAVRAEAAGAVVLHSACLEAERSLFLQPVIEIIRTVLRQQSPAGARDLVGDFAGPLGDLIPDVAHILGPIRPGRMLPEARHRQILEAIAGILGRLERRAPVLLMIDELEHASEATLGALHFLGARAAERRMFVVASCDIAEAGPVRAALGDEWPVLHLRPLSLAEIGELVRASHSQLDPQRLLALTGGLPLYLRELIRHEKELGADDVPQLPDSLRAVIAGRISGVGAEVIEVLQVASIFGDRFTLEHVAALGELRVEDCAGRIQRAMRADLVVAAGSSFGFTNRLLREVVYRLVPEPTRMSRHRRAAVLLEANPEAAAAHWAAAGAPSEAVQAWLDAADRAHRALSAAEAERLLTLAVPYAQRLDDPRVLGETLLSRGQIRAERGDYTGAHQDHQQALDIAREQFDNRLEARALEQLGWTALYARDALTAANLAARSTWLAEAAAAAPEAPRSAWLLLGRVRHQDGDYAGAVEAYDRVAGRPDDEIAAQALTFRGAVLQHMDRFTEAQQTLSQAVVLCRSNGLIRPLLQALFFTALALGDSGDFDGALGCLQRARRLIDRNGVTYYSAGVDTTTSWLLREIGELAEARNIAERAVEQARKGGGALELEQGLHAVLALADCDLAEGDPDTAGQLVEQAVSYLDTPLPYRARAHMRLLEMQCRFDPGKAEELLDMAKASTSVKYQALAYWHLGAADLAGQTARALGSDQLLAQVGAPDEAWQAILRLARQLPPEQRTTFMSAGRLPQQWRVRTGRPG